MFEECKQEIADAVHTDLRKSQFEGELQTKEKFDIACMKFMVIVTLAANFSTFRRN